jgi:hypothetical protein
VWIRCKSKGLNKIAHDSWIVCVPTVTTFSFLTITGLLQQPSVDSVAFACNVNYMPYTILCIILISVFLCSLINVAFPTNMTVLAGVGACTVVYSSV